jgi:molybdopterin-guanine dinucleotide biosynthesis protein A
MPTLNDTAGVILAGGKSSRMGKDKSTLKYLNDSFLETIIAALNSAQITPLFTSGLNHFKDNIPDDKQSIGPLGGIYSSLKYLANTNARVLFIPVDMPLITRALLLPLIQTPFKDDALCYDACHFPLLVKRSPRILSTLNKIIHEENSDLSIKNFLTKIKLTRISCPENRAKLLKNINTPEDYDTLVN